VQLYAFDLLMSAGDDLRPLPLHLRKNHLAEMLRRASTASSSMNSSRARSGRTSFALPRHGPRGIVSKHRDRPYRAGRSPHWIKVKNRTSPAMNRPEGMF
jgi:bifunctional non-homologous end joining protein LigD